MLDRTKLNCLAYTDDDSRIYVVKTTSFKSSLVFFLKQMRFTRLDKGFSLLFDECLIFPTAFLGSKILSLKLDSKFLRRAEELVLIESWKIFLKN